MALSSGRDNGGMITPEGLPTSGDIEISEETTDVDSDMEGINEGPVSASGIAAGCGNRKIFSRRVGGGRWRRSRSFRHHIICFQSKWRNIYQL